MVDRKNPNVISLSDRTNNGGYSSPESVLRDTLNEIGKRGAFKNGKKLLILALDDTDENFEVSFIQAGMKMSECMAVCEVAKSIFKKNMNY